MRAGPKQAILTSVAAPKAFVRQMESTSRDPLQPAACGGGRSGHTRHCWPGIVSARAQAPSTLSRASASGSYLAARHAGTHKDAAAAAAYYRAALRSDPRNSELLGRAFLAVLANGEVDEAVKLAERVVQVDKTDRIARLVLGVRAIKQKQYAVARREIAQSVRGPITDLAATLLSAWTLANPTEAKSATDMIDKLSAPIGTRSSRSLHAGMILDVAGQKKEAAKRLERALQARSDRVAGGAKLRELPVTPRQ